MRQVNSRIRISKIQKTGQLKILLQDQKRPRIKEKDKHSKTLSKLLSIRHKTNLKQQETMTQAKIKSQFKHKNSQNNLKKLKNRIMCKNQKRKEINPLNLFRKIPNKLLKFRKQKRFSLLQIYSPSTQQMFKNQQSISHRFSLQLRFRFQSNSLFNRLVIHSLDRPKNSTFSIVSMTHRRI